MTIPRVHLVAGARPNFMKVAPLWHELKRGGWCDPILVHTGQHYDANMSTAFIEDLRLPRPHVSLEVGSGGHGEQTALILSRYEEVLLEQPPDWVVVVGDVNSTLAGALAAAKLAIPIAHLEAGLRSYDRTMPEEINRLVTDQLSQLLWTPSRDANENLLKEGISESKISFVGNIMIDSLEMLRPAIEKADIAHVVNDIEAHGVVTLHRPSNVDERGRFGAILGRLVDLSQDLPLVFPVHPRTRSQLDLKMLRDSSGNRLRFVDPLPYVEFLALVSSSKLVITDSGGLQEETTYLGTPCLTLRPNTERPITITQGTNKLVDLHDLVDTARAVLDDPPPRPTIELWDGRTAQRAAADLRDRLAAPSRSVG